MLLGTLLGLNAAKLLYLLAKTNGGYDNRFCWGDQCTLIPKAYVSKTTREFFTPNNGEHSCTEMMCCTVHSDR